jgi:hypothetical protein
MLSYFNDKGNIIIKVSGHHFPFNLDMHINEETNMFEFRFDLIQSDLLNMFSSLKLVLSITFLIS